MYIYDEVLLIFETQELLTKKHQI